MGRAERNSRGLRRTEESSGIWRRRRNGDDETLAEKCEELRELVVGVRGLVEDGGELRNMEEEWKW